MTQALLCQESWEERSSLGSAKETPRIWQVQWQGIGPELGLRTGTKRIHLLDRSVPWELHILMENWDFIHLRKWELSSVVQDTVSLMYIQAAPGNMAKPMEMGRLEPRTRLDTQHPSFREMLLVELPLPFVLPKPH